MAFSSAFHTLDLSKFVPFRRAGIDYSNDDAGARTFSASPKELRAVLKEVSKLPAVTAGGVANDVFVSFSLFNSVGGTDRGFEAILDPTDSAALFEKLRRALKSNPSGLKAVNEMGCALALLQPGQPTDVSANVSVALSGFRLDHDTGLFVGTARVTNTSAQKISGPISLVVDLQGNVSLSNASGRTCAIIPVGREFISLPIKTLPPKKSAQVTLELENPDREVISVGTKVLAGPGAR